MRINFFRLLLLIVVFIISSGDLLAQVNWTKYPDNPILTGGPIGSWNRNMAEASVLYNSDSSRYEMWFVGTAGSPVFPYRIGYAKSIDGISWDMLPDPVLTPTNGTWDEFSVQFPFVIRENGQYKMWYSSTPSSNYYQCKIGYATSLDGINWTKRPNPIFERGTDSWEAGGVMACYVLLAADGYKIWYTGFTTSAINGYVYIGYATSVDGISWQRDTINNPVLTPGVAGGWEGKWVWYPEVLFIDKLYYMWYAGSNTGYWDLIEVGLATSSDGIEWTKHPQNPVLSPSPGMWDGSRVECSSIQLIGDSLWMWYHGIGSFWQFGIATSPFEPVSVEQETIQPTAFSLEQNFPNPFNPSTKIKYYVPQTSNIVIKVFDVLGNEIETLVNQEKPVGNYEINWNAEYLPSGVYFYQLKAGSIIQAKKMLLLK